MEILDPLEVVLIFLAGLLQYLSPFALIASPCICAKNPQCSFP
jgi:hypothetical protein